AAAAVRRDPLLLGVRAGLAARRPARLQDPLRPLARGDRCGRDGIPGPVDGPTGAGTAAVGQPPGPRAEPAAAPGPRARRGLAPLRRPAAVHARGAARGPRGRSAGGGPAPG